MRMVCTGHLHFALGIEKVGVGGYMGVMVLYFFGRRIATVSDLSVKRHPRVTVCCAGCLAAVVPTDAQHWQV